MMIVQSIWLHQPTYKLCMKVVFPSNKLFVEKVLLTIRGKKLATYVQPTLATCIFDLWMSTKAHEMFIVIVNFLWSNWEPKHVMFVCLFVAWFPDCKCSLTYFLWHFFFWYMWRMKGIICKLMQLLWTSWIFHINICHVVAISQILLWACIIQGFQVC